VTTMRFPSKSELALRFFGLSVGLLLVAMLIAVAAVRVFPAADVLGRVSMPFAFWISTLLLAAGSVTLQRAAGHVRLQRLDSLRRLLAWSLLFGTIFVGVQACGLLVLVQNQTPAHSAQPESAETGANAFVVMVAGMHGVHIVVALLFIAWVTVNAYANRYDHEYSSSVTFCAWFWHALGIVWLVILSLFAAGTITGFEGISVPDPQTRGLGSTRRANPAAETSHQTAADREDRRENPCKKNRLAGSET
jgi:cytochrome c oxidase subunit III